MVSKRSVLIVDSSQENREVLRTVLERRGLRILAADRAGQGLELAQQHQPDLIVLDLETDGSTPEAIYAPFANQSRRRQTPLVLLGTLRDNSTGPAAGEFVSKPYHYGPLIRRIEELVIATGHSLARAA